MFIDNNDNDKMMMNMFFYDHDDDQYSGWWSSSDSWIEFTIEYTCTSDMPGPESSTDNLI